jgi:hypothetical protein
MVIITNSLSWSAHSVCDLYRRRWDIEMFFKQVKQTLKLSNFLGDSANAVRRWTRPRLCGCALWRIYRTGHTALHGFLRWCDQQRGKASTISNSEKAMGQHRGKSDMSGRGTMHGGNSGPLEWPHRKNDSLLQQGRSHGTATTLEKIFAWKKPATARVQISSPSLRKKSMRTSFSSCCGTACINSLRLYRACATLDRSQSR